MDAWVCFACGLQNAILRYDRGAILRYEKLKHPGRFQKSASPASLRKRLLTRAVPPIVEVPQIRYGRRMKDRLLVDVVIR